MFAVLSRDQLVRESGGGVDVSWWKSCSMLCCPALIPPCPTTSSAPVGVMWVLRFAGHGDRTSRDGLQVCAYNSISESSYLSSQCCFHCSVSSCSYICSEVLSQAERTVPEGINFRPLQCICTPLNASKTKFEEALPLTHFSHLSYAITWQSGQCY